MKKIATLLLLIAFVAVSVLPARSVPRTVKKETVKTETSMKVEKTFIKIYALPDAAKKPAPLTLFNISELNRPPGITLAKANLAPFKRYKPDALNKSYKLNDPVPILRRTV